MAARARRQYYDKHRKGTYHCTARCVRQAFLCGKDPVTGEDYGYRRDWILERLRQFAELFQIDIEFYAVLANHLHLILRTQPHLVSRLSDREVAYRFLKATRLAKRLAQGIAEPDNEKLERLVRNKKKLKRVRKRLADIRWFMGLLCENIARWVNHEEDRKGHFWEDRFRCRECVGEEALLLCAAYVDLNPLQAGEAPTIERSRYASIFARLRAKRQRRSTSVRADCYLAKLTRERDELEWNEEQVPCGAGGHRASDEGCIRLRLDDYVRLLRATARLLASGERSTIPQDLLRLLAPLDIDEHGWLEMMTDMDSLFCCVVGRPSAMAAAAQRMGRRHLKGVNAARRVFR